MATVVFKESRTEIKTTGASSPIGPYSQALKVGSTLYISGSVGVDPSTKKFAGADIESQTVRTLKNIEAILEEAGMSLPNVVKTTILLADIREFSKMNAEYAKFFKAPYPARAAYQVANLPESARVEIEAIAVE